MTGGNRLLLVLSAAVGSKVWRIDGSSVTTLGVSPRAAAIDAKNNFYVASSSLVITRYRTGFGDVDPAFTSPATSGMSNLVGIAMTAFEDELFVYGGTADNIGGPVPSDTVLLKYSTTGALVSSFNQTGVASSFKGRFTGAKLVKTADGRLYVARKLTDNSGQRSILRYWD